jgi:anti-sigma factor RsiW
MYCQDCVDLLADYVEGALPEERRRELEEHLSYCPPCVTFVRTYKATSRICRKHLEETIPEEVGARLHEFLKTATATKG